MLKSLLATTLLAGAATAATAGEITVLGWGGAYGKSHLEAYLKPYAQATGTQVNSVDADNPAAPIKVQVEAGNVSVDVASVEYADAIRLCDEGLLEEIDPGMLAPGADGTPAEDDFIEGALADCLVSTDVYSTVIAFDSDAFSGQAPSTIADFFDVETFPGRRAMRKTAKANMEMALMADGVPAAEVYDVLATGEGIERAFMMLDRIKGDIVWWEAGAQPPQLLADGEVGMTTAYNGRIFNAVILEDQSFEIIWDGQVYELEGYVIPKGAPNLEDALDFVKFATSPAPMAKAAEWISYGPPRTSAAPLVGLYQDGTTEMAPHLPTSEANLANALASSYEFWVDMDVELNERFNAWLAH